MQNRPPTGTSLAQFKLVQPLLPKPRGNRRISNYRFLNAQAFMASNACKWRSLPSRFGPWHTVYMRFYRWAEFEVLSHLQQERLSCWWSLGPEPGLRQRLWGSEKMASNHNGLPG